MRNLLLPSCYLHRNLIRSVTIEQSMKLHLRVANKINSVIRINLEVRKRTTMRERNWEELVVKNVRVGTGSSEAILDSSAVKRQESEKKEKYAPYEKYDRPTNRNTTKNRWITQGGKERRKRPVSVETTILLEAKLRI